MNPTIETIMRRKSIRSYDNRPIEAEVKDTVIKATLRAPTAGNLMLYSIIEVNDITKKNTLAITCDNQPFIAKAPWLLLFVADYQRWIDYFLACDVESFCAREGLPTRLPAEGDLMLACCDAIIAAQTAVIAAESLGVGSCYIGDIMENFETHRSLFDLPRYTFPICLLCFGYPDTKTQTNGFQPSRFDPRFIVFQDTYKRLQADDFIKMYSGETARRFQGRNNIEGALNIGQQTYRSKYNAEFAIELNRSVRGIFNNWMNGSS
jgi:nitroreductase